MLINRYVMRFDSVLSHFFFIIVYKKNCLKSAMYSGLIVLIHIYFANEKFTKNSYVMRFDSVEYNQLLIFSL